MLDLTASSCPRCGAALSSSDSSAGLCPACLLLTALPHTDGARDTVSTLAPGTQIGPFRIVRLLGRGGMATVYEAVEDQLERSVALKVLPPEFLHEETFARRFEQEARVVAKLEHPHIVPIFAAGIDEGIPWMSMRLMAGGNLAARLARGALEPAEGLLVLRHVAAALDYAHARRTVHRDVKPANILFDAEGQVYLADFGLALMLEGGTRLSNGVLTGTPHYMSPEQALGQLTDHRTDIYSLAIVAYEMFTGTVPFQAESPIGVLMKHVNDPLPVPAGDALPPGVFRALREATAKTPGERCASAGAFVAGLERAFNTKRTLVSLAALPALARELEERMSKWVAVAGGVFASAALLVILAVVMRPEPAERPAGPDISKTSDETPGGEERNEPGDGDKNGPIGGQVESGGDNNISAKELKGRPTSTPGPSRKQTEEKRGEDGTSDSQLRGDGTTASTDGNQPIEPLVAKPLLSPFVPPVVDGLQAQPDTVVKAVLVDKREPVYPRRLITAAVTGRVVFNVTVGASGAVTNAQIVHSDDSRLEEPARAAVMQYRYKPQLRNGTPEQSVEPVTVSFTLK